MGGSHTAWLPSLSSVQAAQVSGKRCWMEGVASAGGVGGQDLTTFEDSRVIPALTSANEGDRLYPCVAHLLGRCSMKNVMLLLIAGLYLASVSALSYADELTRMKEDMKSDMGKAMSDMKGEQAKMKAEAKAEQAKAKASQEKMKTDANAEKAKMKAQQDKMKADVKAEQNKMKGQGEAMKGEAKGMGDEMKAMGADIKGMTGK